MTYPSHDKSPAPAPAEALSSLRALLLGDEKVALDRVTEDLEILKLKYGDKERFQSAVAEVLADALTDARSTDQQRLARSISPIVASSIKREIANSKDEMVEALYPITGRLVAASVRNSIAKLTADINERLERMFSFKGLFNRWRMQLAGGSSVSMMLADTQRAEIQRAMIIERASGVLISEWYAPGRDLNPRGDSDLVSGLLSAISNLADEAFGGETSELRTLDLNGHQVALRRSPMHIVALEFNGDLTPDDRLRLDQAFADCVERLNQYEGRDAFMPFVDMTKVQNTETNALEAPRAPHLARVKTMGQWLAGLAVAALCLWMVIGWVGERQVASDIAKLKAVFTADISLKGFPFIVDRAKDGGLLVTGLYPMGFDIDALNERSQIAVGERKIVFDLQPVARASDFKDLEGAINSLRRSFWQRGVQR